MLFRRKEDQPSQADVSDASGANDAESREQRHLRRRTIQKTCHVIIEFDVGFSIRGGDDMQMDKHKTKGRLLDLSSHGACVLTKYEIAPGQHVTLEINLQETASIKPNAQVRWTKPVPEKKGHACGVQFLPLSAEDGKKLAWFLDELDRQIGGSGPS